MAEKSVTTVSPTQAWELQRSGALLIDVRSHAEVAEGALNEAIHHPHEQLLDGSSQLGCEKERPVVLFCKVGGRAQKVGEFLIQLGFQAVYNAGAYDDLLECKTGE